MPPRTAEERATHARRAAALYQAAAPQASPQRPSPKFGGGGKESGGELDALYARAMALSKEKEQQFRASVGRSSRALVGDGGATEQRMPPATALPPPTPPSRGGAHAASHHAATSPRRSAAASAAAPSSAAATATARPSSDESSAVELVNTILFAALPMVQVGQRAAHSRLIAKPNEVVGSTCAGYLYLLGGQRAAHRQAERARRPANGGASRKLHAARTGQLRPRRRR